MPRTEPDGVRRAAPAIACLALLFPGCGGSGEATLRPHATERTVTRFVVQHTGFHPTDVTCPAGVPATAGTRLQCRFTGPDGPYTAYIRVLRVKGEHVLDHIVTRPRRNGPRQS